MSSQANEQERPLVTFALFAYNQERFIREAVEGAFSQDYSPLQIILSDDSSSDRTFEIMREMAEVYDGPHEIVLNRNDENLGIGGHVNHVMSMARGELVVMAAGDDISFPERTKVLVQEWQGNGFPAGLGSRFRYIDEQSVLLTDEEVGEDRHWTASHPGGLIDKNVLWKDPIITVPGCAAAWSMKLWVDFGDLRDEVVTEDNALSFRANIAEGLCVVPEYLLLRRVHDSNVWCRAGRRQFRTIHDRLKEERDIIKRCLWRAELYEQMKRDLDTAVQAGCVPGDLSKHLYLYANEKEIVYRTRSQWWDMGFVERVRSLKWLQYSIPREVAMLLPLQMYCGLAFTAARARRFLGMGR